MSFDEFLARPRYEIQRMIDIISEVEKKKSQYNEKMLKGIDSTTKNLKDSIEEE